MSLTLSIAKGGLLGGQEITLTGVSFGSDAGTVTLEGRACTVESWADAQVIISTPPRLTNGLLVLDVTVNSDGDIAPLSGALVVTLADEVTAYSADYTYLVTRWDIALGEIRAKVGQVSTASGDNYTISPYQIRDYAIGDDANRGAGWPQITLYGGELAITDPDAPYDHDNGSMEFVLAGTMPLSHPENWDAELRALGRDLHRAVRRARETSKVAHQIVVERMNPQAKPKDAQATSALGSIIIEGKIYLEHRSTDMNTNTGV